MKRLTSLLLTAVMIINLIPNSLITAYASTTTPQQVEQTLTEGEETPAPTIEATEEPAADPTEEPVAEPTEEPAADPTEEPVADPTEEPVAEPTEEPAAEPTEEPVAEPTEEPVADPTEEPVAEPTDEPVADPTEEPVAEPTEEPVAEPTVEPSDEPMLMMAAAPFAATNRKYDHIDVKIPAQYHVTVDGVDYVFTGAFDADTIVVTIKGVSGSTSDKVYRYSDYIGTRNYSTRTEYDGSGNTMNEYNINLGNRALYENDFSWSDRNAYRFGDASNIYLDGRIYFTATSATREALALVFPYDASEGKYYLDLDNFRYTSVNECTYGNGLRSDGNSGNPSGLDMYLKIADVGTYITKGRMSIDKTVLNPSGQEITPDVNFQYTVELMSGGRYIPVYFTQATSGIVYDGTSKTAGNTNILTVNPSVGATIVSGLPVGLYRITELQKEGYVIVSADGNTGTNYTLDYVVENKTEDNIPVAMFTNQQLTNSEAGVTVKKTVSGQVAGYQNPTIAIYRKGGTSPLWSMSVTKDVLYYPAITLEGGKTYQIIETNETTEGYVSTKSYSVNYGGTTIPVSEDGTFTVPAAANGKLINIVVNNHYEIYVVPTGNLTIEKVFVDESGNPLPQTLAGFPDSIAFTVSGLPGVVDVAGDNWSTTIFNIEEGTYTVTENTADAQIPGYTLVKTEYAHTHENGTTCTTGSTSNTIDAHASEDKLTVTNVYRKNVSTEDSYVHDTFTVYKVDPESAFLPGAEFKLYTGYDPTTHTGTGAVVGTYTTDADGKRVIDTSKIAAEYLPDSGSVTYYLVETKAPDYYLTPVQSGNGIYVYNITISVDTAQQLINNAFQDVHTYTVSASYTENMTRIAASEELVVINLKNIENFYTGSATLTKLDGTTEKGLANVVFKLYADKDLTEKVAEFVTDEKGELTIDINTLIENGQNFTLPGTHTYYMQEATPAGYAENNTVYTVQFTSYSISAAEKVSGENYFQVIHTYIVKVYNGSSEVDTIINTRNQATAYTGMVGPVIKTDVLTGTELAGVKFVLYASETPSPATAIVEYTTDENGQFYININDLLTNTATRVLENAGRPLPTQTGGTITLYLQESQPLAGYAANTTVYPVTVKLDSIVSDWNTDHTEYVTTFNYMMTFAAGTQLNVTNTNRGDLTISKVITVDGTAKADFLNKMDITVRVTTLDGQQYTAADGWTEYTENGQSLAPKIWYKDVTLAYADDYTVTLENLIPGDYQVTEIVTNEMYVDGYALKVEYSGTNHDDATVIPGTAVAETITNSYTTLTGDYHSDLVIFKIDADSHEYLGDAQFTLYGDKNFTSETKIMTVATNSDGIAVISTENLTGHLPVEGSETLYLKETTAPDGYTASAQIYEVVVTVHKDAGNTYEYYTIAAKYLGAGDEYLRDEVTVENSKNVDTVYGTTEFAKIDSETAQLLNGAQFTFYGDEDFVITTGYTVTVENGKAVIDTQAMKELNMLPQIGERAIYYLDETLVPDGYRKVEGQVITVEITATETEPSEDKNAFTVTYTAELLVNGETAEAVENDRAKANVFTYAPVTLVKYSDSGLAIRPENPATFGVFATADSTQAMYTFKAGEFDLTAEGFINHLLGDADFVDSLTANGEGSTKAYLKEITAPIGYLLDETAYEITIGATVSDYVYNEETKLFERIFHFTINSITGLEPEGNGYRFVNSRDFTDPVVNHDTLTVTKVDPDGIMLEGAEFELTDTTGNSEFYTGGQFTISTEDEFMAQYIDLLLTQLGDAENGESATTTLMLVERTAPHGYYTTIAGNIAKSYSVKLTATRSIIWNGAQQKFQEVTTFTLKEVAENGNEYDAVNIVNNPIGHGQLTINKVKFATDIPLEGAQFALFKDHELTMPIDVVVTTDENGIAILSTELINPDMLPNEGAVLVLYLAETQAPAGYTMTDEIWSVAIVAARDAEGAVAYSITANNSAELTVENHPNEKVTVKKYWENVTGTPDPIQVQLYKDGTPYGDAVTLSADNTWYHVWENLPGGAAYTVEEVKVPDGFTSRTEQPAENSFVITNTGTSVPQTPSTPDTPYSPDTSDSTGVMMWATLTAMSATMLVVLIVLKKKNQ